jgi:HSP20 family protein
MTSITRWNPVRDLIQMREAMDQLMNDRFFRVFDSGRPSVLPMDAYVEKDAIVLVADVPGLKPEDLEVVFEGDTLTIRGEFKAPAENKNYLLRERLTGKFERTLTVNTPIEAANITAEFEAGVLRLTLPKAEAAKPKQITVQVKQS